MAPSTLTICRDLQCLAVTLSPPPGYHRRQPHPPPWPFQSPARIPPPIRSRCRMWHAAALAAAAAPVLSRAASRRAARASRAAGTARRPGIAGGHGVASGQSPGGDADKWGAWRHAGRDRAERRVQRPALRVPVRMPQTGVCIRRLVSSEMALRPRALVGMASPSTRNLSPTTKSQHRTSGPTVSNPDWGPRGAEGGPLTSLPPPQRRRRVATLDAKADASAGEKKCPPASSRERPNSQSKNLEIRGFHPSPWLFLRGEFPTDKGKPSNLSTRGCLIATLARTGHLVARCARYKIDLDGLVSLSKRRGFVFQSSEAGEEPPRRARARDSVPAAARANGAGVWLSDADANADPAPMLMLVLVLVLKSGESYRERES